MEGGISIFPNPTTDRLTISTKSEMENWELRSVQGVLLAQGNGQSIDLSEFPLGMYVVTIGGQSYQVFKK